MNDIIPAVDPALSPQGSPLVVAGPCSAESAGQVDATARELAAGGVRVFRAGLWKPRTKPGSFEGVGEMGLPWLADVRRSTGMLIATEVATSAHVEAAIRAGVDILWIGARTTTNPFAVEEIARTIAALDPEGRTGVMVKNPVNPDVDLWEGALMRVCASGVRRLSAVHRGFSSYGESTYRNTPHWPIATELRLRHPGLQILCDPSHIGGRRDLIEPLSQTAIDLGFDGLMIESHCDPASALSDASQQLTPAALIEMIGRLELREPGRCGESLDELRSTIDAIDAELLDAIVRRMDVSVRIGALKRANRMAVVQPERFNHLLDHRIALGRASGLGEQFVRNLFAAIHNESIRRQL